MSIELHNSQEPSVTSVVQGIIHDAQELITQQFDLVRAEIKDEVRKVKEAGVALAVGLMLVVPGCFMLCMMIPQLLNWLVPALPLWACYGIVGGAVVAVGVVSLYMGARKLGTLNPMASQSMAALKENVKWMTNLK